MVPVMEFKACDACKGCVVLEKVLAHGKQLFAAHRYGVCNSVGIRKNADKCPFMLSVMAEDGGKEAYLASVLEDTFRRGMAYYRAFAEGMTDAAAASKSLEMELPICHLILHRLFKSARLEDHGYDMLVDEVRELLMDRFEAGAIRMSGKSCLV